MDHDYRRILRFLASGGDTTLSVPPSGSPLLNNGGFCMLLWCAHDLYGTPIFCDDPVLKDSTLMVLAI